MFSTGERMKDLVGIVKGIDMLGRIVIPKELRERYGLSEEVELNATEHGITLRNPEYKLVKIDNQKCKEDGYQDIP